MESDEGIRYGSCRSADSIERRSISGFVTQQEPINIYLLLLCWMFNFFNSLSQGFQVKICQFLGMKISNDLI